MTNVRRIASMTAGMALAFAVGVSSGQAASVTDPEALSGGDEAQFATAFASAGESYDYTDDHSAFGGLSEDAPSSGLVGDMNHDGVVDAADVSVFVMALTDPEGYEALYGVGAALVGDINQDGTLDAADVAPFVQMLTSGQNAGHWSAEGDDSYNGAHLVPLPAAAWAGLALLGAMGGTRLVRRRVSPGDV